MNNPLNIKQTSRSLLEKYPKIKEKLPWVPLMDGLPTPVQKLEKLSEKYKPNQIWIKRDDLCSSIYGGNKPRKFEFLFADALKKKNNKIVTAGGIGTNHGLATALFCKELGLESKIYMFHQPVTKDIKKKLLMYLNIGAEIARVSSYFDLAIRGLWELLTHSKNYLILPGGSPLFGLGSILGCVGFVNAGFELKDQVDAGMIPEPDKIFIATGSTGSASGLILGCKLAGLKSKVCPVQVSENIVTNPDSIQRNIKKTLKKLRKIDSSIPAVKMTYPEDFEFVSGYLGERYGAPTDSCLAAINLMEEKEGDKGFHLDPTYTGKACAAMFDDVSKEVQESEESIYLFWNTYSSRDISHLADGVEYNELPKSFHEIYEEDV